MSSSLDENMRLMMGQDSSPLESTYHSVLLSQPEEPEYLKSPTNLDSGKQPIRSLPIGIPKNKSQYRFNTITSCSPQDAFTTLSCFTCGNPATKFDSIQSRMMYAVNVMCQKCQYQTK